MEDLDLLPPPGGSFSCWCRTKDPLACFLFLLQGAKGWGPNLFAVANTYFNNLTRVRRLDVPPTIDTIGKTLSLHRLVVSSNAMMHLPRSLGKLPSLEELVLDHNMMTSYHLRSVD